jgi:SET domain-containing protein
VFAKANISQGEFITVYSGEVIDKKAGEERLKQAGGGYLFFVGNTW